MSSGADRLGGGEAHRPAVETGGEAHDRHAGALVAGHDRALDRRRPAPARQQRGVHVQQLVRGQQRLLDQRPEGAHHQRIRLRLARSVPRPMARSRCSGCSSAIPSERARSATGGAASRRPRPRGRSGRLSTSAGRCSLAASRSSTAAANSERAEEDGAQDRPAVPRRRRYRDSRAAGLAAALAPLRLARLGCASRIARIASLRSSREIRSSHQDAVEVVDLVLDHPRRQPARLHLELLALCVTRAYPHFGRDAPPRRARRGCSDSPRSRSRSPHWTTPGPG